MKLGLVRARSPAFEGQNSTEGLIVRIELISRAHEGRCARVRFSRINYVASETANGHNADKED